MSESTIVADCCPLSHWERVRVRGMGCGHVERCVIGRHLSPHPCPLPPGEGETFPLPRICSSFTQVHGRNVRGQNRVGAFHEPTPGARISRSASLTIYADLELCAPMRSCP
jgi:hypothetical protein